jgi:heat-inducible transcriptional repressor
LTVRGRDGHEQHGELDGRDEAILRAIIREHVLTGEPIGSRTVSRARGLGLSPASIRAVMASLEERGYLRQPHTSAGRVPTAKAYRAYVDGLTRLELAPEQTREIEHALYEAGGEIRALLEEASRQLSRLSRQVGVVLAPEIRRILVEHVEFVRLDDRRLVAILVGRSGWVHHRILPVEEAMSQPELDRMGRYLSHEFGGRSLPEMRELLQRKLSEERANYDAWIRNSLRLADLALDVEPTGAGLYVDGASNLLEVPEFTQPDRMRGVMRALEEKTILVELLGRVLDGDGVQVVIGEEDPSWDLDQCSLVASTYGSAGRVMGTVGIVGPTRMEYARAIAVVDTLARVLTRMFSPGN